MAWSTKKRIQNAPYFWQERLTPEERSARDYEQEKVRRMRAGKDRKKAKQKSIDDALDAAERKALLDAERRASGQLVMDLPSSRPIKGTKPTTGPKTPTGTKPPAVPPSKWGRMAAVGGRVLPGALAAWGVYEMAKMIWDAGPGSAREAQANEIGMALEGVSRSERDSALRYEDNVAQLLSGRERSAMTSLEGARVANEVQTLELAKLLTNERERLASISAQRPPSLAEIAAQMGVNL